MWGFKHYFSHKGGCIFIFSSILTNTSKIQIERICRNVGTEEKVGFRLKIYGENSIVPSGTNFMILIYKSYCM